MCTLAASVVVDAVELKAVVDAIAFLLELVSMEHARACGTARRSPDPQLTRRPVVRVPFALAAAPTHPPAHVTNVDPRGAVAVSAVSRIRMVSAEALLEVHLNERVQGILAAHFLFGADADHPRDFTLKPGSGLSRADAVELRAYVDAHAGLLELV